MPIVQGILEWYFPDNLSDMMENCSGTNSGCYSLAYSIKSKTKWANKTEAISGVTPYGSNFNNVVDHYIERGCQSDLPKYLKDKVKPLP